MEAMKDPNNEKVTDTNTGEAQSIHTHEAGNIDNLQGQSHLARNLGAKEVQVFSISAAIGTSVFITMGKYLPRAGPAGLLIGYSLWCLNMICVNACFAEMTVYAPVATPFITFTSQWVDEALAFSQAWSFYLTQALLVPAEITALQVVITYWTDKMPVAATVVICLVLYGVCNAFSVELFGRVEFYLGITKIFLILMCFAFALLTMVGCNPQRHAYGFTYWKTPGAFGEYLTTGSLGTFWGILSVMSFGSFAIIGPEYTSSVAAETKSPRSVLLCCFNSFKWRLGLFFVGSAICIGIIIPHNDPTLLGFIEGTSSGGGTAAASPYTIAMDRMNIPGLPHFLNALLLLSIFSCGNGVLFASTRVLFVMGQNGRAPSFLGKTTKRGVPIYAVSVALLVGLLAMMKANSNAMEVLNYFIALCTVCTQYNYLCVCIAYLHFYHNMRKQGIPRETLPMRSPLQPYAAWVGGICAVLAMVLLGFDIVHPFSVKWFFIDYTFLAVFPLAALTWKFMKKTKYVRIGTADLGLNGAVDEVNEYENLMVKEPETWFDKIFSGMWEWKDLLHIAAPRKL